MVGALYSHTDISKCFLLDRRPLQTSKTLPSLTQSRHRQSGFPLQGSLKASFDLHNAGHWPWHQTGNFGRIQFSQNIKPGTFQQTSPPAFTSLTNAPTPSPSPHISAFQPDQLQSKTWGKSIDVPNAFPSNQNPNSFPSPLPDLNFSLATPALTPTPRLQHFVHTPPQVCVYDVEMIKRSKPIQNPVWSGPTVRGAGNERGTTTGAAGED